MVPTMVMTTTPTMRMMLTMMPIVNGEDEDPNDDGARDLDNKPERG